MGTRFNRLILIWCLVMLVIIAARPYIAEQLFSATAPRPVEARSDLADYERTTIAIFDRVSPSVVQVAGAAASAEESVSGDEETAVQSGTRFVWDAAGHIVTNNHVVQGTKMLAVRLASGEVGRASIVGVAPSYDLAVIHIDSGEILPAPIVVGSSGDPKVGQKTQEAFDDPTAHSFILYGKLTCGADVGSRCRR
jgi:S1-C subfamily serine protease